MWLINMRRECMMFLLETKFGGLLQMIEIPWYLDRVLTQNSNENNWQ